MALVPRPVFANESKKHGQIEVVLFSDDNSNGTKDSEEDYLPGQMDLTSLSDPEAVFLGATVYEDGHAKVKVPLGTYQVCISPNGSENWTITGFDSLCREIVVTNTNKNVTVLFPIKQEPINTETVKLFMPLLGARE